MSNDFGLLDLVASIGPERRLGEDQPRRPKPQKPKTAKKPSDGDAPEESQQTDDSISSLHIDLRI